MNRRAALTGPRMHVSARALMFASIGLLSLLAVGCAGPPPQTASPTEVSQPLEIEYVGHVLDAATLQPIAKAKITLTLEGVPPIVHTDNEGVYSFEVALQRDVTGQVRVDAAGYEVYIRNITISPTLKTIEDIRLSPITATDVPAAATIPPPANPTAPAPVTVGIPGTPVEVSVGIADIDHPLEIDVCVEPGMRVRVSARGTIVVGPNIGSTDADGKDSFTLLVEVPIDKKYYSLPEYSHGSLLCRVGDGSAWEKCGTGKEITAGSAGCVQLAVNDSLQTDNSGSFDVTVEVLGN